MGDIYAGGFADALSFLWLAPASINDLTMGVLGILRKKTFSCGLTWMSWAWLPACDNIDFVAVLEEFVGKVVDVGACASCERPILGRDEANLRGNHLRLPATYRMVVIVAPTNQAHARTKYKTTKRKAFVMELDDDSSRTIIEIKNHYDYN